MRLRASNKMPSWLRPTKRILSEALRQCAISLCLVWVLGCESGGPAGSPSDLAHQPIYRPSFSDAPAPRTTIASSSIDSGRDPARPALSTAAATTPEKVETPTPVAPEPQNPAPLQTRRLTLKEAVQMTLAQSPLLAQRTEAVYEAEARLREMQNLYGPRLQFDYLAVPWRAAVPERVAPNDIPRTGTNRVSMSMFVPVVNARSGRDAAVRQAMEEVKARKSFYDLAANDTTAEVVKQYAGALEGAQVAQVCDRIVELNQERVRILETLRERKLVLGDRVLLGERLLAAAREEATYRRQEAQNALRKLARSLGLAPATPLELVTPELKLPEPPQLEEMRRQMAAQNPVLARLINERNSAYWTGRVRYYDEPRANMYVTYGADFPYFSTLSDDFLILGLTINWPMAKVRLDRAKNDQAYHRIRQLELEREIASNDLEASLEEAYAGYAKSLKRLEVNQLDVELAAENVRLSELYRKHGTTDTQEPQDVFQLTANRITLEEAKAEQARSRTSVIGWLVDLYKLTGTVNEAVNRMLESPAEPPRTQDVGLWIWQSRPIIEGEGLEPLLALAGEHRIGEIYLYLGSVDGKPFTETYAEALEKLLTRCHEAGLRVHGLMGEPDWATAEGAEDFKKHLEAFVDYERKHPGQTRFDALHLDIEPHALAAWGTDRWPELARTYLERLTAAREALAQAELTDVSLVVDIPPTYQKVVTSLEEPPLAARVMGVAQAVVVMDYRTDAVRIADEMQPILRRAAELGVPVRVGLDTAEDAPEGTTFAPLGCQALLGTMEELRRRLGSESAFAGLSIHDLAGFRALCEQSKSKAD